MSSTSAEKRPVSSPSVEEPQQEANPGFFGRIKRSFKGATKSGRREDQAKALLPNSSSVEKLRDFGGVKGLLAGLGTDEHRGLDLGGTKTIEAGPDGATPAAKHDLESHSASDDAVTSRDPNFVHASEEDRIRVFGRNLLPERKSNSLLLLMWLALQDKILILLCVAAVVSLALGIYTKFGVPPEQVSCVRGGIETICQIESYEWVEGVAILVAIVIVDLVGSVNDYQKELQFKKLNAKKEQRDVKLEPGEIVPCDGIFLRGHKVKCDESGATGESDMIRKIPYDECIQDIQEARRKNEKPKNRDCFLISGSKVLEGVGEYVVIAVGPTSFNGKLMLSLRSDAEDTPLQSKLNRLADLIAWLGSAAGITLFTALMIRFFVNLAQEPNRTANEKAQDFIHILIIAVTVIVVAVPEGLPLAVTLALAFATKRMTKMNLLVRLLGACETMANASVVCTDKTGTLTQNEMSVVAGSIGVNFKFADRLEANRKRVETEHDSSANGDTRIVEQSDLNQSIGQPLQRLLNDSIAINSTAFEEVHEQGDKDDAANPLVAVKKHPLSRLFKRNKQSATAQVKKETGFVGSKTETALLKMAKELGWQDYRASRDRAEVVQMIPFSSERKAMGVVVKRPEGGFRVYLKGASEVLTRLCTKHVEVGSTDSDSIPIQPLDDAKLEKVNSTITGFANQTLRTLALVYRDLESFPPKDAQFEESGEVEYGSLAKDLTLVAIAAIEDPLRPGVTDAVEACRRAGVQCGIYTPGGIVMEGPVFRRLNRTDMLEIVPRLQVLARSSPEDKKILVESLKSLGEVVGVTGDGTNDGPALKTANVGFSMGIAGTEVAKEASDIILMDDNFASIVSAIMWGRCVNDAVRKFLQFQLSVNISAVVVTFVTAVASSEGTSALKAVQLLWINLIMDTLAALALATDPATPDLLDRKPDRRNAPLISTDMWKMIIGQSVYQFTVILVLDFAGMRLLNLTSETELSAIVFNAFVWCQLFNQINSRSLNRKLNIFSNLHMNPWFIGIMAIEIGFQVLIMFVGGVAFSVTKLTARDWGVCIIVGLVSWPLAVIIRLTPTQPIENFLVKLHLMPDPNALPAPVTEGGEDDDKRSRARTFTEWLPAVGQVGDQLNSFRSIRGGRIAATPRIYESREQQLKRAKFEHQSVLAMVPGFIVAGIGGNWRSDPDSDKEKSAKSKPTQAPVNNLPPVDTATLYKDGKLTFHPETNQDDDLLKRLKSGA
ncbi:related to putative calcium P-type ATPase NCA-2 [Ustilago sp. UG-2017b]|nr:related to putative calcium P-type ATPase NCA-2 [Ustilago sp. UG-2017b]